SNRGVRPSRSISVLEPSPPAPALGGSRSPDKSWSRDPTRPRVPQRPVRSEAIEASVLLDQFQSLSLRLQLQLLAVAVLQISLGVEIPRAHECRSARSDRKQ